MIRIPAAYGGRERPRLGGCDLASLEDGPLIGRGAGDVKGRPPPCRRTSHPPPRVADPRASGAAVGRNCAPAPSRPDRVETALRDRGPGRPQHPLSTRRASPETALEPRPRPTAPAAAPPMPPRRKAGRPTPRMAPPAPRVAPAPTRRSVPAPVARRGSTMTAPRPPPPPIPAAPEPSARDRHVQAAACRERRLSRFVLTRAGKQRNTSEMPPKAAPPRLRSIP